MTKRGHSTLIQTRLYCFLAGLDRPGSMKWTQLVFDKKKASRLSSLADEVNLTLSSKCFWTVDSVEWTNQRNTRCALLGRHSVPVSLLPHPLAPPTWMWRSFATCYILKCNHVWLSWNAILLFRQTGVLHLGLLLELSFCLFVTYMHGFKVGTKSKVT